MVDTTFSAKNGIVANSNFNANSTQVQLVGSILANSTGVYANGLVNATSYNVGALTVANSIGVYTGIVNGSSITVGSSFTANATLANTPALNVVNQTNTATLFVSTSANVGSNVQLSTSTLLIGNSTVNNSITSTNYNIANSTTSVSVSSSLISIGNSTVNTAANSTAEAIANTTGTTSVTATTISIAANAASFLSIGNSSVNTTSNSTVITTSGIAVSGIANAVTLNASNNITVGANVKVNTSILNIGNSSVNTNINSSSFFVGSSVMAGLSTIISNSTYGTTVGLGQVSVYQSGLGNQWSIVSNSIGITLSDNTGSTGTLTFNNFTGASNSATYLVGGTIVDTTNTYNSSIVNPCFTNINKGNGITPPYLIGFSNNGIGTGTGIWRTGYFDGTNYFGLYTYANSQIDTRFTSNGVAQGVLAANGNWGFGILAPNTDVVMQSNALITGKLSVGVNGPVINTTMLLVGNSTTQFGVDFFHAYMSNSSSGTVNIYPNQITVIGPGLPGPTTYINQGSISLRPSGGGNGTINSTSYTGTANNANNLGGVSAASYLTTDFGGSFQVGSFILATCAAGNTVVSGANIAGSSLLRAYGISTGFVSGGALSGTCRNISGLAGNQTIYILYQRVA
jgi:hypothetical protein